MIRLSLSLLALAFAAGIILTAVTIESGIGYPICVDYQGGLRQQR